MSSLLYLVLAVAVGFLVLLVGLNLLVRWKAGAMRGQPLPEVPGPMGPALAKAQRALVYFFSPQCGACRMMTPKMRALSGANKNVFVVDITEQLDVARALRVLATPTTLEIEGGKVVGVHIGSIPPEVERRYAI
jgi:thioredoxin 1